MTAKKTETKRVRAPRVTQAEIARRQESQQARDRIGDLDGIELASRVRGLALRQAVIFDYELLLHVADILEQRPLTLEPLLPSPIPGVGGDDDEKVVT